MMETRKLAAETVLQNRYRILSLLKRGGMGRVYLAEDLRFHSRVAVKEAYFTDEEFRRAFAREAGLLHRLRHRVLPHVTDHFTEGEAQYLVMQLFPGKDLDELLDEKIEETGEAFAVNQVLRWADQLLDALEYIHGNQPPVVHRDIKPQNLKLTEQGDIILLDFGLAKGVAAEMSQMNESKVNSLPGFTYHYAPLEQILGTGTDPRSDLYALAATVYRLITGHIPSDALTRAAAALERQPDPLLSADKLNGQVPEAVAAVLTRALAQVPGERPATATEMRRALRAAVQPQAKDCPPITTPINRSWMESDFLGEYRAPASLGATKASASAVTNAGLIVAQSPAPGINEKGAAFAWVRWGSARAVYIILCLLLSVLAALAYWLLNTLSGSSAADPPVGETAITRPDGSATAPKLSEAMRYYLQAESKTGRAERVAGDNPTIRGPWLKFHFRPSWSGYLYIIGPDEQGRLVAFLTAQPNSASNVKDNRLEKGTDYSFPPGQKPWILLEGGASTRTYTVIFAPKPLVHPRFLAGPADGILTAAEVGELGELRERFGQGVRVDPQNAQYKVAIPAERMEGEPYLFDINFSLEANKKGDQR
jgi:serine/threonine protein kinase